MIGYWAISGDRDGALAARASAPACDQVIVIIEGEPEETCVARYTDPLGDWSIAADRDAFKVQTVRGANQPCFRVAAAVQWRSGP